MNEFYIKTLNYIRNNPKSIKLENHTSLFNYEAYQQYDEWMKNIKLTNIDDNFNDNFDNKNTITEGLKM